MESNDDGLFNRFLISVGFKRKPNRDCRPPDDKIPKLVHLFYYTLYLHKQQQEYSFNPDGMFYVVQSVTSFSLQLAYAFMKETVYSYDCESVSLSNDDDYLAR